MIASQEDSELRSLLSEIAMCLGEIRQTSSSQDSIDFLTVKEASRYLNVSDSLLRKWLFKNQIKPHRFGRCIRFNKKDLNIWISQKSI